MSQYLPTGGFKWLSEDEIRDFELALINEDAPEGFILEVDLEYPEYLHDSHNDLPFCPQHMIPPGAKVQNKKLLTTLYSKKNYMIHY